MDSAEVEQSWWAIVLASSLVSALVTKAIDFFAEKKRRSWKKADDAARREADKDDEAARNRRESELERNRWARGELISTYREFGIKARRLYLELAFLRTVDAEHERVKEFVMGTRGHIAELETLNATMANLAPANIIEAADLFCIKFSAAATSVVPGFGAEEKGKAVGDAAMKELNDSLWKWRSAVRKELWGDSSGLDAHILLTDSRNPSETVANS